jgi:hypothetical protein
MALTDTAIKKFKYTGKASEDKLADGDGMYRHAEEAGSMAYRYEGKQKHWLIGFEALDRLLATGATRP